MLDRGAREAIMVTICRCQSAILHFCAYLPGVETWAGLEETLPWYRALCFSYWNASYFKTWVTLQKQWGLNQNKVIPSLTVIQRPGHLANNRKMVYLSPVYMWLFWKLSKIHWKLFSLCVRDTEKSGIICRRKQSIWNEVVLLVRWEDNIKLYDYLSSYLLPINYVTKFISGC